ncbi:hypothetical protein MMP64_17245 [Acinetobacter sp. ANC 5659]|uniref:hypothetical protein n=1 Tax=Acinetobacter higginsii TaxID=70347 RepID=UPI0002D13DEF|nr:hypothetical protein [Acinetobacter higginsii]ENX61092.1 hypothetical protein F885_01483 [Acinetobacter higginsii]MCH7319673.1 hypothetical protein [Acinetobacter higginsii]
MLLDWVVKNKEWVLSGFGVVLIMTFKDLIVSFIKFLWNKLFGKSTEQSLPVASLQPSVTNQIIIGNQPSTQAPITSTQALATPIQAPATPIQALATPTQANQMISMADLKKNTHILFVDDKTFKIVKTLVDEGWIHTKLVKDITTLDSPLITGNEIFFIDIQGVGTKLFNNEGIGLANIIQERHPEKKVILYSAETTGNRFDPTLRKVDAVLEKNAEPYEFIQLVEKFAREISNA